MSRRHFVASGGEGRGGRDEREGKKSAVYYGRGRLGDGMSTGRTAALSTSQRKGFHFIEHLRIPAFEPCTVCKETTGLINSGIAAACRERASTLGGLITGGGGAGIWDVHWQNRAEQS